MWFLVGTLHFALVLRQPVTFASSSAARSHLHLFSLSIDAAEETAVPRATLPEPESVLADAPAPPPVDDPMATTLELLEWSRLSQQVATFANTGAAREILEAGLPVRLAREASELLHIETEEMWTLEQVLAKPIDLRSFINIDPLVRYAQKGGELDGESIVGVGESLLAASNLLRTLRAGSSAAEEAAERYTGAASGSAGLNVLPSLFDAIPEQAALRLAIAEAFDETGSVRDSADPALGNLRFARREVATAARRELGRIIQLKADSLASTQVSMREDRYVLQVVAKRKHEVPGTVRDVSASGATLFIEPKALEPTNTKLRQLAKQEAAIERAIRKQFSQRIGAPKMSDELLALQQAVTRVDLAAARARYSARLDGRPVTLCEPLDPRGLVLPALRHPLLVWRDTSKAPDASQMVPMDICVPPSVRAVVITGPNTGGKTVCLKTLGMAALMAKAGLRVLCADTSADGRVRVPCFESVLADIGDDQSIVQSLSTFSAHVARMRRIMNVASASSGRALVLLDEVGSGTDPTEGSALGMAVLRALASEAALTLATTHHGRLKSLKYADGEARFENACVEFDVASMAPTYRLLWGIPGKSNALAIAERLGLQPAVVEDARALLSEESDASIEMVIGALQKQQAEQRALNEQLLVQQRAAAAAEREATQTRERLLKKEQTLRDELQAELANELTTARATIAQLVQRAQQASSAGGAAAALRDVQQASQELARLGEKASGSKGGGGMVAAKDDAAKAGGAAAAAEGPSLESIAAGDRVLVPRLGENPVAVDARKGTQLTVVYGGLKMNVKLKEVTKVLRAEPPPSPPKKAKAAGKGSGGGGVKIRFASNTLDLRGQRPSEIETELGRAIDRASSAGSLWVIHGHGTGSLRSRVRELLLEDPMVASIEDAPQNEGGAGCTVAILK